MPSASVLEQKKQIVAEFTEKVKNSVAGVVVGYQGITVEDDTALRKELREAGIEYTVIKNTLAKLAFNEVGYSAIDDKLNGMSAFATSSTDPVAAAKILKKYADKIETFTIKAGYVDGEVLDEAGVNQLADIPSKEVLIAKVLGSLQSSLYNLAYVLQAVVDKDGEGTTSAEEVPADATVAE